MGKIVGRLLILLIPILLVVGLFRLMADPTQSFLPDANQLIRVFSSTPDFQKYVLTAVREFEEARSLYENTEVNNFMDWIESLANWLVMAGDALAVGWTALCFPFEFVGYVVTRVLGIYS